MLTSASKFWPLTIGVIETQLTKLVAPPAKHRSWECEGKAVGATCRYLGKWNALQRLNDLGGGNTLSIYSQPKLSISILAPGEDLASYERKNASDIMYSREQIIISWMNKCGLCGYKLSSPLESAWECQYPQATWAICTSDKLLMFLAFSQWWEGKLQLFLLN